MIDLSYAYASNCARSALPVCSYDEHTEHFVPCSYRRLDTETELRKRQAIPALPEKLSEVSGTHF